MKKILGGILFLCALLIYCFYDVCVSFLEVKFPLNKIQVEAPFINVSKQQVEHEIIPYLRKGFFLLDQNKIYDSLLVLPWVEKVDLNRIWPDILVVKVRERRPIARFNKSGLIDVNANVFYPKNIMEFELPHLIGEERTAKQLLQEFKKMSSILAKVSLLLDVLKKEPAKITLTTKDGLKIVMSSREAVNQLNRFVVIYPELAEHKSTPLVQVDLRYRHGLAVKWQ